MCGCGCGGLVDVGRGGVVDIDSTELAPKLFFSGFLFYISQPCPLPSSFPFIVPFVHPVLKYDTSRTPVPSGLPA